MNDGFFGWQRFAQITDATPRRSRKQNTLNAIMTAAKVISTGMAWIYRGRIYSFRTMPKLSPHRKFKKSVIQMLSCLKKNRMFLCRVLNGPVDAHPADDFSLYQAPIMGFEVRIGEATIG